MSSKMNVYLTHTHTHTHTHRGRNASHFSDLCQTLIKVPFGLIRAFVERRETGHAMHAGKVLAHKAARIKVPQPPATQ